MVRKIAGVIAFLMLFGIAPPASAVTLIDTVQGQSCCFGGYSVTGGGQSVALPFSSASAVTITDITAFVGGVGSVDFGIMADSSGVPSGAFLFHQVLPVASLTPIVLTSLNWSISGGTTYWLAAIATAGTAAFWQENSNLNGPFAFTLGGVWTTTTNAPPTAIISANEFVTPLPATLPLFISGLGALGLVARYRKRKTAAA